MTTSPAPRISVIVPVYEARAYLPRCLASLAAQTLPAFEAILVDDGSTDGSAALIDEAAARDPRFRAVHQANGGVGSARNAALPLARGEYLFFLDADDALAPRALALLASADPAFDLVVCGQELRADDDTVVGENTFTDKLYRPLTAGAITAMLAEKSLDYAWGKRFRADIIRENGLSFYAKKDMMEDTVFVSQYLTHSKCVKLLPGALYYYYKREGTTSGFDRTFIQRAATANQEIERTLSPCFPEVFSSLAWGRRVFSVYHYSLSMILAGDYSAREKLAMLREIFSHADYRALAREDGGKTYMPDDGVVFRFLARRKSPLPLFLYNEAAAIKTKFARLARGSNN